MKNLLTKLMWFWMILALSACSGFLQPVPTETPIPTMTKPPIIPTAPRAIEPTKAAALAPTQTRAPVQTATSSSAKQSPQPLWSIKSGNIIAVGAAADGKLYGYLNDASSGNVVVLSITGQVLKSSPVKDLLKCGGQKSWFVVRPNGTIISTGYMLPIMACIIEPGDPPVVTILEEKGGFLPYSNDPKSAVFTNLISRPAGFDAKIGTNGGTIYWNDTRDTFYKIFGVNRSTRQGFFINQNGNVSIFKFPENIDFEKNLDRLGFFYSVMPWDDVYVQYSIWDSLGNLTGKKAFKVAQDGTITQLAKLPSLVGTFSMPIVSFLPELKKFFILNRGLSIEAYDTDFNLLTTYILPAEIKNANENQLFVGNDLALYYFNFSQKTLAKYALPGN